MRILIVVEKPKSWPLDIPGVEVIAARSYLTERTFNEIRGARVFNLCRSYRYQSLGYYVSLLAEARGHRPLPNVTTIQDMKSQSIVRIVSDELEDLIQSSLSTIRSDKFVLSIYFGRNMAKRYKRLSLHLFNLFQAPLLRAHFVRNTKWALQSVGAVSASEIPADHKDFIIEVAKAYFAGRLNLPKRFESFYDLAILWNPDEKEPPSDPKALEKFITAAESLGIGAEIITKDDIGRLSEFDALFIRETTNVNHHTYRIARRAEAEGMVVIDDPLSILKCANKVYLAELLDRHKIPTPKTLVVHRDNVNDVANELGFPCILKQPDSSFSQGVTKVEDFDSYKEEINHLLQKSELVIAQSFLPTPFDWRIGIVDGQPLYACKYFMANKHWQIINHMKSGGRQYGKVETLPVELAPKSVVRTALRAANLIGNGLYGVDLKEIDGKSYVIEVNDNPNLDSGFEDAILRERLYLQIMQSFYNRLEDKRLKGRRP